MINLSYTFEGGSGLKLKKENDNMYSCGDIKIPLRKSVHHVVLNNFSIKNYLRKTYYKKAQYDGTYIFAEGTPENLSSAHFRNIIPVKEWGWLDSPMRIDISKNESEPPSYAVEEYDPPTMDKQIHIILKPDYEEGRSIYEEDFINGQIESHDVIETNVSLFVPENIFSELLHQLQSLHPINVNLSFWVEAYYPEEKLKYEIESSNMKKAKYCYLEFDKTYNSGFNSIRIEKSIVDFQNIKEVHDTVKLNMTQISREFRIIKLTLCLMVILVSAVIIILLLL